jgi:hypothetical protein
MEWRTKIFFYIYIKKKIRISLPRAGRNLSSSPDFSQKTLSTTNILLRVVHFIMDPKYLCINDLIIDP